jgi:DNA-binding NarL/FixJ family response regulator
MQETNELRRLRILVADDHPVVRDGIRLMIEKMPGWEICGEAATGREAVKLAEELRPDVAVLDIAMPELNGLDATRQIRRRLPETEVMLITGTKDDGLVRAAFEAGARTFLAKTDGATHFQAAFEALSLHKPYFTPEVAEIVFQRFTGGSASPREHATAAGLTERQREILQLLVEGDGNKAIASKLGISVKTVEGHRAELMERLKVDSLSALVRWAIRNHVIEA